MGPWGVRLTWLDCNWIKSFGKLKMDRGFCHKLILNTCRPLASVGRLINISVHFRDRCVKFISVYVNSEYLVRVVASIKQVQLWLGSRMRTARDARAVNLISLTR